MGTITLEAKNSVANSYIKAKTNNAYDLCVNTRSLIRDLKTVMIQGDIHDYDKILEREKIGANLAWFRLMELKNEGWATQTANEVLDNVDFLVKDTRFSSFKAEVFGGEKNVRIQ
jgi:hypothetical protein